MDQTPERFRLPGAAKGVGSTFFRSRGFQWGLFVYVGGYKGARKDIGPGLRGWPSLLPLLQLVTVPPI